MKTSIGEPQRVRRLRLAGWWLGALPALLCALSGTALLLLPLLERLPQADRPYGWLLDRLAQAGGYGLLVLAALFAALAAALFLNARKAQRASASGG
jgi:hypothetical protein